MKRVERELRYKAVAKRIRELRNARGWSIEKLAQETTISWSTVSRIERAQGQQPSVDAVGKILFALEVAIEDAIWVLMRLAGYPEGICKKAWAYQYHRIDRHLD